MTTKNRSKQHRLREAGKRRKRGGPPMGPKRRSGPPMGPKRRSGPPMGGQWINEFGVGWDRETIWMFTIADWAICNRLGAIALEQAGLAKLQMGV